MGGPEHKRGVRREAPNNPSGKNFLRFRDRASRRKPVIYHPWQIPLGACASPLFSTLRHMTRESVLSTTATPALSPCFASPLQCPRALRPRAINVGGIHRPVKNGIQKKGDRKRQEAERYGQPVTHSRLSEQTSDDREYERGRQCEQGNAHQQWLLGGVLGAGECFVFGVHRPSSRGNE